MNCVCIDIIGTGIFGKQGTSCLADCPDSVRPASVFGLGFFLFGFFNTKQVQLVGFRITSE